MSPNISTREITERSSTQSDYCKKEIFYNGYFYDVTDFVDRHPGGTVLKFYTEHGEDATQAIEQFHYRSKNKVEKILQSLGKRKAGALDHGLDPTVLRHELLSNDFKKLFNELEAEGYFEPCVRHVVLRLLEAISLLVLAFGLFFECKTVSMKFLSTIFCGFSLSRFGWLMHEGGHNSLTGNPKVDKFIQKMSSCFTYGFSSIWWNSQHNRHHAMPQRLEHDVDLETLPFVAFHRRTVSKSRKIYPFFIKYQAVLYWTIYIFLVMITWRFVIHPRFQLRKKNYYELALGIPNLLFYFFVMGPVWYLWTSYWLAFFLLINFTLSHSHLDVADKPTHWIEYSLTHTANIQQSIFVDYFMGYLNYQIEHHLFPTMPQFRQRQICHRVKKLAEKHGLPYRVYSYNEACILALKNLHNVGKQVTRIK